MLWLLSLVTAVLGAMDCAQDGCVAVAGVRELAPQLASVTVLDARDADAFRAGHIPGSQRMDWTEWTAESPGLFHYLAGDVARWGQAPPTDAALQERLRVLGLSNGSRIYVVGQPGGWGEEGRIAWNMLLWGAERVHLVDGGFPAWKAAGLPVAVGKAQQPAAGTFTLHVRGWRRSTMADVKAALAAKVPILDARTEEEFRGKTMIAQKRGGHVPGAVLVPVAKLYQPDGRYVDRARLRMLTALDPASQPVTYCTGGVRSALLALLLESRLGISASNYDASMWEWAGDPALPMSSGP